MGFPQCLQILALARILSAQYGHSTSSWNSFIGIRSAVLQKGQIFAGTDLRHIE